MSNVKQRSTKGKDSEDCLKFSSSDHAHNVLQSLEKLRRSATLCDIEIRVGKKTFQGHRAILSASSPFFEAMFTNGLRESLTPSIQLEAIQEEVFSILMDFIYTGFIEIKQDNVQDLLVSANMLQLQDVVKGCCTYLKKQMHTSNCIGIYQFADIHACDDLKSAVETYICQHFVAVSAEEEFLELPSDILKDILLSERLCIDFEEQVFQAAMVWIFHKLSQRRRFVFQLMEAVRLPLIPDSFLRRYIKDCSDLSLQVALSKIFDDHKAEMKAISAQSRLGHTVDPLPRACPRQNARKNIFVIGGYKRTPGCRWSESQTLNDVEVYDTFRKQWDKCLSMCIERSSHGVAALNGLVYAVGGESYDSSIFAHGEVFDPAKKRWTLLPSMTTPRTALGLVALYNRLYAIGGWVGCNVGTSVEEYDPDLRKWTSCGEMFTPRCAMGIVAYQGLIYIAGGLSDMHSELDSVECYNPLTKEWSQLASLNTPKAYIGLAVLHNSIYAVGGVVAAPEQVLSTVERYSFETNKWEQIPPMKRERAAPCVAAVNGLLYVIGGRSSSDQYSAAVTYDIVECYDPQTNAWTEDIAMPTCRCQAGVAVL